MRAAPRKDVTKTTNLQRVVYGSIGILAAMLSDSWTSGRILVQMALFSVMVFGPLLLFLWPSRRSRNLRYGMAGMLVMHGGLLYLARAYFPFRSVFSIVPFALCEATLFAGLALAVTDRENQRKGNG